MAVLLDNVNVDTNGSPYKPEGNQRVLIVRAESYGGGTVEFQLRENGSDAYFTTDGWHTLVNGTFTADAEVEIDHLPDGCEVRAILTGSALADKVRVVLAE